MAVGTQEVGSVSIRVTPNLKGFRRQLKAELEAIEKAMRLEIPVDLDTRGATAQIADLRRRLENMRGANIEVGVDERVVRNTRRAATYARTLRGALAGVRNSFSRIRGVASSSMKATTGSIRVARRAVRDFRDEVNETAGARLGDRVMDGRALNRFRIGVTQLTSSLRVMGRVGAQGFRNLGSAVADMDGSFRRTRRTARFFTTGLVQGVSALGKGLRVVTNMATLGVSGFGRLSRVGKIVMAVFAGLPAIIGPIATLIAGLPSLLGAAGAAAGVLALGFDGVKQAAESFGESIAPLRQDIAGIFSDRLTTQLQGVSNMLYAVQPQLEAVTNGLLDMSGAFLNVFTSASGIQQMNTFLSNTAGLFKQMAPGMRDFGEAFLTLATGASESFDVLANVINNFASSFSQMADRVANNGVLQSALEGLAAVTEGLLDGFVVLVEDGMKAMAEVGEPLGKALSSIFELLGALLPVISPLLNVFLELATVLAEALTPIMQRLTPVFQQIGQTLAEALVPAMRSLAPAFGALIEFGAALFQALSPLFPILTQIATVIANVLMAALEAIRPVLPVIQESMQKIADVINTALKNAQPTLERLATNLGEAIVAAVEALAPLLPDLIESFLRLVEALLPLLPPIAELIGKLLPPLIEFIAAAAQPVLDLAADIIDFLVPAFNWVIDVVGDVLKWLVEFGTGLAEVGGDILNWFKDLPGKIMDFFSGVGEWLWQAGKDLIQGFWNGIKSLWNDVTNWISDSFSGLVDSVAGLLGIGSPSKIFRQYGRWLMEGLQLGVEDVGPEALKSVEKVADQIASTSPTLGLDLESDGVLTLQADSISDAVQTSLAQWRVEIDRQGIARLVREANAHNRER